MVFFVETFCNGDFSDHNSTSCMRVLHEIHCPLHCMDLRFSDEEHYLCDCYSGWNSSTLKGVSDSLNRKADSLERR